MDRFERQPNLACLAVLVAAALAGCAEAHDASSSDGGRADGAVLTACGGGAVIPLGEACSFAGRCPVLSTDWVDGMCGDEGYECRNGRVVEYQNLWVCEPGPDPSSPCGDPSARAEAFSLSASDDVATLGVAQACTSATGWGDCDGGTVSVELLDVNGNPLGHLVLTFEDEGHTTLSRTCQLTHSGESIPCSYEGQFDLSGQACGGESGQSRLCGQLAVQVEGETLTASVALRTWSVGICF